MASPAPGRVTLFGGEACAIQQRAVGLVIGFPVFWRRASTIRLADYKSMLMCHLVVAFGHLPPLVGVLLV